MEQALSQRAGHRLSVIPRAYGSLGRLTLQPDGSGLYRSRLGDTAHVSAALVARLGLTDDAKLHARLRLVADGRTGGWRCELVHVIAWYVRGAKLVELDHGQAVLQAPGGPRLFMPRDTALASGLRLGTEVDAVAAPSYADRPPWRVVQVALGPHAD